MDDLATNRDLYRFIADLVKRRSESNITLESYLANLRQLVPGPVAVLDASGTITTMDPRDIEEPVLEVSEITWREFVDFLEAGQCYE